MASCRSMLQRSLAAAGGLWTLALAATARAAGGSSGPGAPCHGDRWGALAVVTILGVVIVAVAWMRLVSETRRIRLAQSLLEQGREVPGALLSGTALMDLRRGIVMSFTGAGVGLAGYVMHGRLAALGLVPACIGVGYLVSHLLGMRGLFGAGRGP